MSGETEILKESHLLPIDSAPRDGTLVLALDWLGEPHLVWGDERGFFDQYEGSALEELGWWLPIPAIPLSKLCV